MEDMDSADNSTLYQEEPQSNNVLVSGLPTTTTKDVPQISSGGDVTNNQLDGDKATAASESPDAERVSQKETLKLDETQLTMTLKEIPKDIPKDSNKLHVMGISDKTTKDGLMSFMEAASGREVESMLYGSYSNAMVTFTEPPDLEKVEKKCSTRALDGSHLKIEQVNICDCIEVSGLAPNTTRDTILYYFLNKMKGGGGVRSVELDSKKARALVFFEDPSVVSNVTKFNHVLNDVELTVVPYYPFLGETSTNPGGGKKEEIIKVDPETIAYINKFLRVEFDQLLQEASVKYTWEEGSREIVLGSVDPKMDKETWEKICEDIKSYFLLNSMIEKKTKLEVPLTEAQIDLLNFIGFVEYVKGRFKDLEVTMKRKELSIHFRGPDAVVREGNTAVWQTLAKVKESEIELPKSIACIVGSDAGKVFMAKKFKKNSIDALISFDANSETQLTVRTVNRKSADIKKAVHLVKDETSEESCRLDEDQKQIIQSEKWKQYKTSIQQSMLLQITEEPATSTLWIAGFKDEVDKAKKKVELFFKENMILDQVIEVENGRVKFIFNHKAEDVKNIEVSLKTQSLKIKKKIKEDGILVSGTREGIEKAVPKVKKLINDVKDRRVDLDKPGMMKLFSEKKGSTLLSIVENDHKCIIERSTPPRGMTSSSIEARFSKESSFIEEATPKIEAMENKHVANIGGYDDNTNFRTTAEGMKIMVIVSDLAKEKTHAIVNTVAPDLDLTKNPSAKALSNAAGPGLQQECKDKGQLSAGQILITSGHKLGCKNVFHVVACSWQEGQGEPILRSLVQSCLNEAHKRGFSSIAFPAIGTGNLAFPREVVARLFFEEADAFKSENPQSPLNEVHLVLFHKDTPTVTAFQNELKNRKPTKFKGKRRFVHKSEDQRVFGNVTSSKSNSYAIPDTEDISSSLYIGSIHLDIKSGDITKETTDAIAKVSDTSLSVAQGGVGAAIAKAGGPSIQKECDKLGTQKSGTVVSTKAGFLPTKTILHLVFTSLSPRGISDIVFECFLKAESMGINSIAIPAIGTGVAAIHPEESAKALLSTIAKFALKQPASLNHIRIVVFQKHMLKAFHDAIESTTKDVPGPSFASDVKRWLQVFAANNKDLDKAEAAIKQLMEDHLITQEIKHNAIEKLSDAQTNHLLQIEAKHDAKIQIDKKVNRIVVHGVSEDISNATKAIYHILNRMSEEEHTRRNAELLSKIVQWYYVDGDGVEPYDSEINAQIEQAFIDKNLFIDLLLEGESAEGKPTRYRIDFSTNMETNLDTGQTTRVERRDSAAGSSLPAHWDPQPLGSDGKELDLHLVVLDPMKHKKEYDDIKTAIEKTTPMNIVKIERVQNPSLYKAYLVKKQKMDYKNGSNEKKLFHGTDSATCQLINHLGFNRSFCGKNATCYGKGVYFARDASYSMDPKYSTPDATGKRYMYMASVLAGEYTRGKRTMLAPPPKNPNIPTDTYDTVVDSATNPSIYVVFHDTQNYPDYLITFQ